MRIHAIAGIACLAAALGGCATVAGPVEVTRFSRPAIATAPRGAVSVVPAFSAGADSLEYRSYAAAVGQELARLGYRETPGSATVAVIDVQRHVAFAERTGGPVSVGVGGSTGGYGSGLGVGVGFNLGGRPKDRIETVLAVTIRDRTSGDGTGGGTGGDGAGQSLWEGRAHLIAPEGSPLANTQLGAAKMAQALFQGFPGRSGETIQVK